MDKRIRFFLLASLFLIVQALRTEMIGKDKNEQAGSIFVWEEQYEKNGL